MLGYDVVQTLAFEVLFQILLQRCEAVSQATVLLCVVEKRSSRDVDMCFAQRSQWADELLDAYVR